MHQAQYVSYTGYMDNKVCQMLLRTPALSTSLFCAQAMDHKVCQLIVIMPALSQACVVHRLWTTKSEQEKVPDEEATKRKQESADAKVCFLVLLVSSWSAFCLCSFSVHS